MNFDANSIHSRNYVPPSKGIQPQTIMFFVFVLLATVLVIFASSRA